MSNDKLKLVVSNKEIDSQEKSSSPEKEKSPQMAVFQKVVTGLFYVLWIASIPSVFAISAAALVGAVHLTSEFVLSIAGPIGLVFLFGFFVFNSNKESADAP